MIPLIWVMQPYMPNQYWWILGFVLLYIVVLHPAILQLKRFEEDNKDIIEYTLCSSCKNFDKTAVICLKYDQHPSRQKLPCEGMDWEPISSDRYEQKETT